MINKNIIKFGYGDVLVGHGLGYICFTPIKPPLECGLTLYTNTDEYKKLEKGNSICIFEEEPFDLYSLMENINENNKIIEYQGYILDFSYYNKKSVEVVKKHAYKMINTLKFGC